MPFLTRRHVLSVVVAGVAVEILGRSARAEEVAVPVARQADLLVRVAAYDRSLPARAAGTVRVLLLSNPDDADSRGTAAQMDALLRKNDKIAGLPCEIVGAAFPGATQLATRCKADKLSIVYLAQGLDGSVPEVARALDGVDVLTVGALERYVRAGVVLGFDLVSSKPTLVINLPQSKKQNVAIGAEVLHLMRVIQ